MEDALVKYEKDLFTTYDHAVGFEICKMLVIAELRKLYHQNMKDASAVPPNNHPMGLIEAIDHIRTLGIKIDTSSL